MPLQTPAWASDPTRVKAYQNWLVNQGHQFAGWSGTNRPGYGTFGPQTQAGYSKYGEMSTDPWGKDMWKSQPAGSFDMSKNGLVPAYSNSNTPVTTEPTTNADTPMYGQAQPATSIPGQGMSKVNWGAVGKGVQKIVPFVSNLVNSLRTPPMPTPYDESNPIVTPRVSYNNQRQEVARQVAGANSAADANLDENSSAAVRQSSLAQALRGFSAVNEGEANANAQISGENARTNAGIDANNAAIRNAYKDNMVGRNIAIQRNASENLSNAADKQVMISNERAKGQLDLDKLNVIKEIWKQSGVYSRMMKTFGKEGMEDPTGIDKQFATGGKLRSMGGKTLRLAFGGNTTQPPVKKKSSMNPIYTNNPNDPRLKAYQDSLNLYNSGVKSFSKKLSDYTTATNNPNELLKKGSNDYTDDRIYGNNQPTFVINPNNINSNIKPISSKMWGNNELKWMQYQYKKPVDNPESNYPIVPLQGAQKGPMTITPGVATRDTTQDGDPVYGPANSTIGYLNNGQFSPYNGVNQRGIVNNSDTDLLNNPEELRKYLGSKGITQFATGGSIQQGPLLKAYNPNLAGSDQNFQQWYNKNTMEGKNGIPYSDKLDYDYYSYFRNGDYKNYQGGHFPDTYKRPNHSTFSDESIYSVPGNKGGHWNGDQFIPAKMAMGGSIHIDPKNKGKFTSWAKGNGMSVQGAASKVMANKSNYSPTIMKRANLAKNFGGSKAMGGSLTKAY